MTEVMKVLEERLRSEQALKVTLETRLQACPPGRVQISVEKGYPRYYQVQEGLKKYIGNPNLDLAARLANKSYYQDLLGVTDKEIVLLREFLENFDPQAGIRVYEEMHEQRKKLVDPLVLPDDLFAEKWLAEHRAMAAERPNEFEIRNGFQTLNGEMVRSKSEKILADFFLHRGILYVYECPLKLEDGIVYPDFTLLNLRTRKTFYWEHCGMMDSGEYANPLLQKIFRYECSGFFIGDSLIISMETSAVPLKTPEIEMLARKFLL